MLDAKFTYPLIAFPFICLIVVVWYYTRNVSSAPRKFASKQRKLHWFTVSMGAIVFVLAFASQQWLLLVAGGICIMSSVIELCRKRSEIEKQANWKFDRGRCGQCDYDLSYVDHPGICPECGWRVPPDDQPAQRADWALWWKGWRLDYLDQPDKKMLGLMTATIIMFAIVFVFLMLESQTIWLLLVPILIGLHMCINLVRVELYRRVWSK